ncbi:MAG: DUF1150 family protein [Alphaproteobacteria bacterium]|jgi:hypothetical protein
MNTPSNNSGAGAHPMTSSAFLALGSMHVAYIKPVTVDGESAYAIHSANGQELAVFGDRDVAFVAARQNDLEPVSVH